MRRIDEMPDCRIMRALATASVIFAATALTEAAWAACPDGKVITVSGVIEDALLLRKSGTWILNTDVQYQPGCRIMAVMPGPTIPAECGKGKRFTATGITDTNAVTEPFQALMKTTRLICH